MTTDKRVESFKQRLLNLKEDLMQLELDSARERKPVELDQTKVGRLSRMDAMQGQAMALAVEQRRKVELTRIEAALKRIETGDFGFCVACDEEIALKRLELDPAAPTCIACASKEGT